MDLVPAFRALCESRALRWELGEWEWIGDAVDPLQEWAKANELVRDLGEDGVMAIMAEAFAEEEPADPWTESAREWRAEHPVPNRPVGPPPARCEHCDPGPCRFPTLCAAFEQANRWWAKIPDNHPFRRGRHA